MYAMRASDFGICEPLGEMPSFKGLCNELCELTTTRQK
jgi:hypothetical protein